MIFHENRRVQVYMGEGEPGGGGGGGSLGRYFLLEAVPYLRQKNFMFSRSGNRMPILWKGCQTLEKLEP